MKIKQIFTLSALACSSFAWAQDDIVLDDFEGASKSWTDIDGVTSEVVDNPAPDDVNKSSKVLKCVRSVESKNWAGVILRGVYSLNIGSGDDSYSYATVKFYKQSTGDVSFKLESGPGEGTYESNMPYLSGSGWTTVTFDLKQATAGTYNDFFVMVDRAESLSQDVVVYIDEITLLKKLDPGSVRTIDKKSQNGTGEVDGYHLVWQDLFDDGVIDRVWNIEDNVPVYNNELQNYTRDNVSEGPDPDGNGCLIITAKKGYSGGKQCSSGRLNTNGTMSFTHGKVEASIKFPKTANGLWPAFWMMGKDVSRWPYCGEIDILEMGNAEAHDRGVQDRYFNGACHWGPNSDSHQMHNENNTWDYSIQDGEFHLFTLYWDDQRLLMYLDQDKYPSVRPYFQLDISNKYGDNNPGTYFHHDFHILFNMAIGGDFPKIFDVNGVTALQQGEAKMYVNYVKVYQKGVPGETYNGPTIDFTNTEELCASQKSLNEMSGSIYNVSGRIVKFFNAGEAYVIEELQEGIYFIVLENGETIKIMKRK